jgi:hypothetical protein
MHALSASRNSLVSVLLLTVSVTLCAEEPDFEPIHWAYSSFFGTGWYQIEDSRSVFVMRMPVRQTLRESSLTESGERELGIQIKYPLTLGLHDVDDIGGILETDNFGTVSFAPGVELEIPINKRWYMRTFAHIGWGKELNTGESAWIYYAGVKSRYAFPGKKYDWYLLNSLYYAGYAPDEGRSDHLAVAQLGAELRQPLNKATLFGRNIDLHWSLMYSFLGNELHFNLPDGKFDPINDQIEVAIAMSLRDGPYEFWFFKVHRLGVGYQFSANGQFKAITFSMRSWFTQ